MPYVKGEKRQDSEGQKKMCVCLCVCVCGRMFVKCVHVCLLAKQEGSIRSDLELLSLVEWVVVRGRGWGGLGCLPRPQGLSKAAHTCSDTQQIVNALPSYA